MSAADLARDFLEEEWHAWRATGIGASDVAKILGDSRYGSAFSVWAEKRGYITGRRSETRPQRRGKRLEPFLAAEFHDETGLYVVNEQRRCTHPTDTWKLATLDGEVADHPYDAVELYDRTGAMARVGYPSPSWEPLGGWEAKSDARGGAWHDGIPLDYQEQAFWGMHVTGYEHWWFTVVHAFLDVRVYKLPYDAEDVDAIVRKVTEFWERYVLGDELPPLDAHPATEHALAQLHPDHDPATKQDLTALAADIARWRDLADEIKRLEEERKTIENTVKATMGPAEIGMIDGRPALSLRTITVAARDVPARHQDGYSYRTLKPASKKDQKTYAPD